MKFSFKNRFMIPVVSAALFVTVVIYASSTGITGTTQLNGNGCNCHGGAAAGVMVSIDGPATLQAGETADFKVEVTGGPLAAAGTNIAVSSGDLVISDNSLQKIGQELTHTAPKTAVSGKVGFEYRYTAPQQTGQVTMFAVGNSVDLSGNNLGDSWAFANNKTITVTPAVSVDDQLLPVALDLEQNYPNPFNPSTDIRFSVASNALVTLAVYDVLGREVAVLFNRDLPAGSYTVAFDASELAGGIYYYTLKAGASSITKKMMLLK